MKEQKKLSSFDFSDDLSKSEMLQVKGGKKPKETEVNACHSGTCNINVSCTC